ncbi:type I 3-dehydroquinate dehydratase [Fructobacillus sp. CRL 2054]|uniref:type I 3-dehydroquinate dehydratase n=1 Tax=Fructobacillus sp. CRL 2054 TaxID=2763007 RepID=UPI002378E4A6|nr:type I 3-dehydroquinate dehydratase [Fructobacillus sp. CRL 2054]MDD9138738.1 type I 3-dehydroquinate dehydratase [Fructobacillus sp. CRL 2054]
MTEAVYTRNIAVGRGAAKVALPITVVTPDELTKLLPTIQKANPDIVEWRLDFLEKWQDDATLVEISSSIRQAFPETPIIGTYRTKEEGGKQTIRPADYERILKRLAELPVDMVDVEINRDASIVEEAVKAIHQLDKIVIASFHDFNNTPSTEQLENTFNKMQAAKADVLKVAVMPHTTEDVLQLMTFSQQAARKYKEPIVTMAMGQLGSVTRVATHITHSAITFACLTKEQASAPGQIEINNLRGIQHTLEGDS